MSPIERLEHAFSKAQTSLGIEKLLDPEGIVQCLITTLIFLYSFEYLKSSASRHPPPRFFERIVRIEEVFFLLKCGTSHFITDMILLCLTVSRILQEEI